MKKYFVRLVTAVFGFASLAVGARAQVSDQLIVNIPYEFVVAGKTLQAGTYRVNRVTGSERELVLSSVENRASALLVPSEVEDARAIKPGLTFQEIAGQHFLSKIETGEHVFAISVSRSAVQEAAMRAQQGSTGSGRD
jgi:hypothetical protein